MPRVFVPQHPWTRGSQDGKPVAVGDLTGLMAYGHPVFMVPAGPARHERLPVYADWIARHMFDYHADDYVLMTGDTMLQGIALAAAVKRTGGAVRGLRWNPTNYTFRDFTISI